MKKLKVILQILTGEASVKRMRIAIVLAWLIAALLVFAWIFSTLTQGVRWPVICLALFFPVFVTVSANRRAAELYRAAEQDKKTADTLRSDYRLYGERAGVATLFVLAVSLANSLSAFDAINDRVQFSTFHDARRAIEAIRDDRKCINLNGICDRFVGAVSELMTIRAGGEEIRDDLPLLSYVLGVGMGLGDVLPAEQQNVARIAVENVRSVILPSKFKVGFSLALLYVLACIFAMIAIAYKLGVATFDAKRRVWFSSSAKAVLAKENEKKDPPEA